MKENKVISWRPYQIKAKKSIKEHLDRGEKYQLAVLATGLGKRLMAVDIMKHFPRSLFVAHREELIMQAYNEIEQYFPMQTGIIKGTVFEADKKIIVASTQTLYNRLNRLDSTMFDYIAIDEAHHYVSRTFLKTINHFDPHLMVSWTATPRRLDGLSLSNIADSIVFEYGIDKGVNDGWLAKPDAYSIGTQTDLTKVRKVAGDFNIKQLSEKVDNDLRNTLIAAKYQEYTQGEQAIIFCVDVAHAYHMRDKFREFGISCETVVGDTTICPNRADLIKGFQEKKIQVLTNVNILTEGFDYNDVGCIIMARPTQSETLYIQSIGRGTRLKSPQFQDKFKHDHCIVLDFVDNTGKHNLVNAYELEKKKPIEERTYLPQEHKEKLLEERERREREFRMREGKDRRVNLLELPEVEVWNSQRMTEPATEKQLEWIKSVGYYEEGVEYTKYQASEIISKLPCKAWQLTKLRDWGYDVSQGATVGQFQKIYASYKKENKYRIAK